MFPPARQLVVARRKLITQAGGAVTG